MRLETGVRDRGLEAGLREVWGFRKERGAEQGGEGLQDGQGQFNEERNTYPGGWESKRVLSLVRQKDKQ